MKSTIFNLCIALVAPVLFTGFCLPSGPAEKGQKKKSDKLLVYKYPETPVKYLSTSKVIQTMDVNGQSMTNNVNSVVGCTVKSVGQSENNLKLQITIDTLGQTIETPMGTSGGAASGVIGKAFSMILSPSGREIDVTEAGEIKYSIEGSDANDLAQTFSNFFPDIPDKPVRKGETWNSSDSVTSTSGSTMIRMKVTSQNTFAGYEKSGNRKFAKITSRLSGTREMKTQAQGMDVNMSGPFKGTLEIYFDNEAGYFVKQVLSTTMSGDIEIKGPETMTFPVVMEINSTTGIVK